MASDVLGGVREERPIIHSLLFQPLPLYEVYAQPPCAPPIVPGEEPASE